MSLFPVFSDGNIAFCNDRLGIENLLDSFGRSRSAGKALEEHGYHHHAHQYLRNIRHCCHDIADEYAADGGDLIAADDNQSDNGKIQHDHHDGIHQRHQSLYFEHGARQILVCRVEALVFMLLANIRLDNARTRYVFLNDRVDLVQLLLHRIKHRAHLEYDEKHHDKLYRYGDRDNHTEFRIERNGFYNAADKEDRRAEKHAQCRCHELLNH